LGHALWNAGDYEGAAAVYDRAFELESVNGLPAKNAANAYELLGRGDEALDRYLKSGRAFLGTDNYQDLGVLIPKLLALGPDNWEAHGLAGKWAYGIEDWALADAEFKKSEDLRKTVRPKPPKDPAVSFLRALLLIREGKRRAGLPLLEEAARLAEDYGLFYFRLAENRFLLDNDAADPQLIADLETALQLLSAEAAASSDGTLGWANNLAAQAALSRGDLDAAAGYLEKAAAILGEVPAIRVNRGIYQYLRGSVDEALKILDSGRADDPDGLMANCAGNLLVKAGQYERADEYYQKAITIAPGNTEFICNRASCLIELGYYGEADTILTRTHTQDPSPEVLELISYVALKKGEFSRAESACRQALETDAGHVPSLLSLGWIYSSAGRWDEAGEILSRLEALDLKGDAVTRRAELGERLQDGLTRLIECASCGRSWRVPRIAAPVPPIRLFAMPPDDIPAGSCPECGKVYCIGCAKQHLDADGRFICPTCGRTLKLVSDGLKKIVYDWAAASLPKTPRKRPASAREAPKRKRK
jgi:tetratricopeptide (TPR) repeat protein